MVRSCKLGYLGNHMTDWADILCVLTKRQNLSAHKISAQSVQWFPRYPSLQDQTIYRISLQDHLNYIRHHLKATIFINISISAVHFRPKSARSIICVRVPRSLQLPAFTFNRTESTYDTFCDTTFVEDLLKYRKNEKRSQLS